MRIGRSNPIPPLPPGPAGPTLPLPANRRSFRHVNWRGFGLFPVHGPCAAPVRPLRISPTGASIAIEDRSNHAPNHPPIMPIGPGFGRRSASLAPSAHCLHPHQHVPSRGVGNERASVASKSSPHVSRHFPALALSIGLPALESCTRSLDAHHTRMTAARQAARFFPLRLSASRFNPAFAQRIRVRRRIAQCIHAFRSILHCSGCSAPLPCCGMCLTGPPPSIAARFSRPVRCRRPRALRAHACIQ